MKPFKLKLQLRLVHLLKTLRAKKGWTQKQLAKEMAASQSHVERLESRTSGENALINSIVDIQKYASMMDMTGTDFFGYIEGNESLNEDPLFYKIYKKFQDLSIEDQVLALKLFDENGLGKLEKALNFLSRVGNTKKSKANEKVVETLQELIDVIK
ncbi:MAG: helix-turn-helix domain-containing protein [Oligoflexales bacterium]